MTDETLSLDERFAAIAADEVAEAPVEDGQGEDLEAEAEEVTEDVTEEDGGEEYEETDEDEDVEAEEAAPAGTIEVEIEGQTRRLSAEEVKDGILMRSDYTRKTQALAEEKAAFERQRAEVQAQIDQQLQVLRESAEQEPDWDKLYEEDPLGAPRIERAWKAKQAQKQEALQQRAFQQEQARQQHLAQQAAALPEMIPTWRDPKVAQTEQAELREALIADGFPAEDVGRIADARLVKWLLAGHRELQRAKTAPEVAKKKVAGKPKVQKPGSAKPKQTSKSKFEQDRARARKSQRSEDQIEVFKHFV